MLTIEEHEDMKTVTDHLLAMQKVFILIYISDKMQLALRHLKKNVE